MIKTIMAALNALKYGQELQDPSKWKKGQELTNLVGGLVAALIALARAKFPQIELPGEAQEYLVEIIIAVLVLANIYLTRATTKKIGSGAPKEVENAQ